MKMKDDEVNSMINDPLMMRCHFARTELAPNKIQSWSCGPERNENNSSSMIDP